MLFLMYNSDFFLDMKYFFLEKLKQINIFKHSELRKKKVLFLEKFFEKIKKILLRCGLNLTDF